MRAMNPETAALADDAPHLLVVDDDRRIRDLLSRFLFAEGYRVTTAETAADARAKLEGLRFDLLILDVMMPGETGFEFARKLRASSSVPILMLTARGEAESRIQGLEIGADDYLGKPFEPRELSLRIANILKRARPAAPPPAESVCFGEFLFHIARGELKRRDDHARHSFRCVALGLRAPQRFLRPDELLVARGDAEGPLRARLAHHHRADGGAPVGGRLRVHGATLEHGHAAALRRRGAGHRRADRRLYDLSARCRPGPDPPHRPGKTRPQCRLPAGERHAAAGAKTVLFAARPGAVGGIEQAHRQAVLDRHGR